MMIIEDTYTVYHKIAVYVKVSLIVSEGHPATSPQVNGRLRDHIEVRFDAAEDEIKQQALASGRAQRFIADNKIQRIIYVPGRLVNVVTG